MSTTITPAPAGAGFRLACECGLTWGVAFASIASSEAQAHDAWHAAKAAPRRSR